MPQGLQVFAPNGELIADTNDRFSRIIASGSFPAPSPFNGAYADIHVSPEFTNSADFTVVATGGGQIEIFSTYFRFRTGQVGSFEGATILWTAWAR
ncbi:hypothetical protein [Variovorax sp. JS1663]|uniref:hypothetical protein n=1 Tax=Variovorax sp. JS1663 TaxID=1851577 RepID=UPI000B34266A|nr:hypothetical protein [Variovorax sp. JS1663]OUL98774.1 hypothetical protein A8M77_29980 [Variovorax sp. JS1663]